MGKKGDKLTKASTQSAEDIIEKLSSISGVTSKKMFGGYGIFHEAKMFGIISAKGEYFFKVNETTQPTYEKMGSVKHSRMPYFSIPEEILSNKTKLKKWANQSIEISKT